MREGALGHQHWYKLVKWKVFRWASFFFFFFKKTLLNLLLLFNVLVFGHEACGILAPWHGTEPVPPALEGGVLTTGPPGKSLGKLLKVNIETFCVCVNQHFQGNRTSRKYNDLSFLMWSLTSSKQGSVLWHFLTSRNCFHRLPLCTFKASYDQWSRAHSASLWYWLSCLALPHWRMTGLHGASWTVQDSFLLLK